MNEGVMNEGDIMAASAVVGLILLSAVFWIMLRYSK